MSCAALDLEQPKTFNERLAAGYTTVTSVRDLTGSLLQADKITPEDAQQSQNQADNARAGLDIARSVHATDPTAGDAKLGSIITALNALSGYLISRSK